MTETTQFTQPDDILNIKLKDGEQELFMSAALIRTLTSAIGEEQILAVYTDEKIRELLLTEVLRPRNSKGRPEADFILEDVQINETEARKILKWVEDHICAFFIENAKATAKALSGPGIKTLTQLLTGLQDLAQPSQSVGPTTVAGTKSE